MKAIRDGGHTILKADLINYMMLRTGGEHIAGAVLGADPKMV
jgi:hypothetical protein